MTAAADYLENAIMAYIFNAAAAPSIAATYVGLYTSATDDTSGGTEVTGGSYARALVNRNTTQPHWDDPEKTIDGGTGNAIWTVDNEQAIAFPQATAAWGDVTHHAVHSASSAGNRLLRSILNTPRTINQNAEPSFAAGVLSYALNSRMADFFAQPLMELIFRAGTLPTISATYCGLFTSNPNNGLNNGTELTNSGGTLTGVGLFTASTAGNLIWWAPITTSPAPVIASGGTYARQLVNRDLTTGTYWGAPAQVSGKSRVVNVNAISFATLGTPFSFPNGACKWEID